MPIKSFLLRQRNHLWSTKSTLLLVRPAGKPLDETQHKPCDGILRPVTEENIQDCAAFENPSHYVPIYRSMLKNGDQVFFGYLGEKCVFRCATMHKGEITLADNSFHSLQEGELLIHYSFCAPAARGHGLHSESIYQISKYQKSISMLLNMLL